MADKEPSLIYIVPANRWSGVERYTLDLCRHFSTAGWPVTIFTRDARAVEAPFRLPGVELRHAPFYGFFDVTSLRLLRKYLKRHNDPQRRYIIHVSRYRDALRAIIVRRLLGRDNIRVVMTRHYVAPARRSPLYRLVYRHLDAHIFVSEAARNEFLSAWDSPAEYPFGRDSLTVIHNSLNLPEAETLPEPEKGPVVAMYHGRLAPGKGLETLLKALASLVPKKLKLRLRIVGTGDPDYVDALRSLAERLGIMERIDWHRHVADPLPLIRQAHFGVLPSEAREAFGLANIEYMKEGRPQISTVNGAQGEYLSDRREALIVPPGDVDRLAEAMELLATDATLRDTLGRKAIESFNTRLSWRQFAPKMETLYRKQ